MLNGVLCFPFFLFLYCVAAQKRVPKQRCKRFVRPTLAHLPLHLPIKA